MAYLDQKCTHFLSGVRNLVRPHIVSCFVYFSRCLLGLINTTLSSLADVSGTMFLRRKQISARKLTASGFTCDS